MTIVVPLRNLLPAMAMVLVSGCATPQTATPPSHSSSENATPVVSAPAPAAAEAGAAVTAPPPTAATGATCTSSGPASASWVPAPAMPVSGPPPIVSATAAGDTFTLTFAQGTPEFEVNMQSSARFLRDPSGMPVTLAGSQGATIVLRGFRGDRQNYTGPQSLRSSGPVLLQVQEIGDFEGVVTWAAGLSRPACANVVASGSTLTFRFIP